jgi:hypothetical protein
MNLEGARPARNEENGLERRPPPGVQYALFFTVYGVLRTNN